ncbi:angiopoietin-1 receptor-like [Liolophura sinensis]|uniref:angiopoietin-1 receptor-like n=1 Tax=Liolophura sinensis TaxID=3198878 RepID=UPI00315862F4
MSKTSRSFELVCERTDTSVKHFRLLVFKENDCLRQVHFTQDGVASQTQTFCGNVSYEQFGKSQMNFTYNVTDLFPYIEYRLEMYLKSKGVDENPDPATLNVRTNPEVPSKIKNTNVTVEGAKNASVCWSPPEPFPGPTNYTLTLVDLGEEPQRDRKQVITGFYRTCKTIDSLEEFWPYKVKVVASTTAGKGLPKDTAEFRTQETAPGKVTKLTVNQDGESFSTAKVTWMPPAPRDRNADIHHFLLRYKISGTDENNVTSLTILWSESRSEYSQPVLVQPGQTYSFQVSAMSTKFDGELAEVTYEAPQENTSPEGLDDGNGGMIAMGVIIAALAIILIAFLVVFLIIRRRRHERPRAEDLNMDPYETMKPASVNAERKYEGMRFDQLEISAFRLRLSNENLNKGKHKVLKGTLQETDGHQRSVAIRKITGANPFDRCKAEIDIMRNIGAHPHVVCFLGYSIQDDNTVFLINGFEERGDLQSFLRDKRRSASNTELTEANLLLFAENVAEGMAHLSQLEILHGDLRAVNVLVGGDFSAKISGLQHARPVGFEPKDLAKFTFPLCRWASVETLEGKVYTKQSEVWSFGVLMWEIMTYGATPYGKMKSKEIRHLLSQNCRLACPKSCQIPLYTVMLECWKDDPAERPSFQDLSRRLVDMTTDVQQYMNIGIYESLDFKFEEARADSSY